MSPESLICFIIVGCVLAGFWRRLSTHAETIASLRAQMNRFISDIESEKETRRRQNVRFDDRLRALEKLPSLPHDRQTEE